jgi:hypothetical protein
MMTSSFVFKDQGTSWTGQLQKKGGPSAKIETVEEVTVSRTRSPAMRKIGKFLSDLAPTFTVEVTQNGRSFTVDLHPNGSKIPVTEEHIHEPVQILCQNYYWT